MRTNAEVAFRMYINLQAYNSTCRTTFAMRSNAPRLGHPIAFKGRLVL
jgi:hypothetical protein